MTSYAFKLELCVTDPAALYEATKAKAIEDAVDNYPEIIGTADDPDIAAYIQMLHA